MRGATNTCPPRADAGDPGERRRGEDEELIELARAPWTLPVGKAVLLVRPSEARDLPAVAQLHARCSSRSLLDRYRIGGRAPAITALDRDLRGRFSVLVTTAYGVVVAHGSVAPDPAHGSECAELGLLVLDSWQRRGIGGELATHLAGVAQAAGFAELIVYPATALAAARRLMVEIGRTRLVPDTDVHLHTYLPASATLGLGLVRQRLAG